MEGIKQVAYNFVVGMTPKMPPQLEGITSCICANPLVNRVTSNWKVILMDCSTIIAVTLVFVTFAEGATFLCAAFSVIAISSGVGSFYMRRFAELKDLQETAKGLRETKERFEALATNLERENTRLTQTNQELLRTNDAFRATNQEFIATNTRLTQQVTGLTLQVTQLRESAERIRGEMVRFQQENAHLHTNVQGFDASLRNLDEQIVSSRGLCDQITTHLSSQQQGLGQQLDQLRDYLVELRNQNGVNDRIVQLGNLHTQHQQELTQLNELRVQYAQERGHFEAIHTALNQLQQRWQQAVNSSAQDMTENNRVMRDQLSGLSEERHRIEQLFSRFLPGATRASLNPIPAPYPMQTGHAVGVY